MQLRPTEIVVSLCFAAGLVVVAFVATGGRTPFSTGMNAEQLPAAFPTVEPRLPAPRPETFGNPMAKLSQDQRTTLLWLFTRRKYEVVNKFHCDCSFHRARSESPYVAVGDFNGDMIDDFAALLSPAHSGTGPSALVIFNGPFDTKPREPTFLLAEGPAADDILIATPATNRVALFVGPSLAEPGYEIIPTDNGYGAERRE